jgi:hypothetical protein
MKETVGPVSTCGRELLRGLWRPIGLMVSFIISIASVRNILDTTSYSSHAVFVPDAYCCHNKQRLSEWTTLAGSSVQRICTVWRSVETWYVTEHKMTGLYSFKQHMWRESEWKYTRWTS